jgi:hypothetical protein
VCDFTSGNFYFKYIIVLIVCLIILPDNASAMESSRISAEKVVATLISTFPDSICRYIVQLMQRADRQAVVLSGDPQIRSSISDDDIHYWDAVFICAGYCSDSIPRLVDMTQFTSHLATLVRYAILN